MEMTEPTRQQVDAANFYADVLNEISARIEFMNMAINRQMNPGLTPPFIREIAYLQLRMMCELVAIGCLVVHGDINDTKSAYLQKEYAANRIINRLANLHPNFYPHPVRLTVEGSTTHMDRITEGFLTKDDLVKLYHQCGEKLHRGKLGNFKITSDKMMQGDYSDILGWGRKFIVLLEQHHIASKDNLSHFICALNCQDTKNKAYVSIALSSIPQ